jgi:hypothetical protein
VIFQQDDVKDYRELWPGIKSGILKRKPGEKAGIPLYRRWGFAVSGILAILLVGFMFYALLMEKGTRSEQEGEARFRINSIRVGDEPATPFVYQPKDSDMILVWVEKSL